MQTVVHRPALAILTACWALIAGSCAEGGVLRGNADIHSQFLTVALEPQPGQRLLLDTDTEADLSFEGHGANHTGYRMLFEAKMYFVGVRGSPPVVSYVQTRDPNFRTPEGIGVGDKVDLGDITRPPGRAPYMALESKWRAVLSEPEPEPYTLPERPKVLYFFKTGE